MRVRRVVPRLRLVAVGNLVAWVAIALAGNAIDAIGGNALFEFFHVESYFCFHMLFVVLKFGAAEQPGSGLPRDLILLAGSRSG